MGDLSRNEVRKMIANQTDDIKRDIEDLKAKIAALDPAPEPTPEPQPEPEEGA
jgi:hypothetical protein